MRLLLLTIRMMLMKSKIRIWFMWNLKWDFYSSAKGRTEGEGGHLQLHASLASEK